MQATKHSSKKQPKVTATATAATNSSSTPNNSAQVQNVNVSPETTNSSTVNGNNNNSKDNKSVAQRVMEVTGQSAILKPAPQNAGLSSTALTLGEAPAQDIEDTTARVSKMELNASKQQLPVNNDQNNNTCTSKRTSNSSSPSLLLDSSTPPLTSVVTNNNNVMSSTSSSPFNAGSMSAIGSGLVSCESVFRLVSNNSSANNKTENLQPTCDSKQSIQQVKLNGSKGLEQREETRISLDTKVPHPSAQVVDFQQQQDEEVSYYNDQPTTARISTLEHGKSKQMVNKEHKLSVLVPNTHGCSSTQLLNTRSANRREPLYLKEELSHADYDDYECRYDNPMEEDDNERDNCCPANSRTDLSCDHQQVLRMTNSGAMSTPTSPKAKSAPATPCNVTAFHQHTSHMDAMLNPSPANTLPPDIRKNISSTCRVAPNSDHRNNQMINSQMLDVLVKRGEALLESKDYSGAEQFFSKCIELATQNNYTTYLKKNFKVYSQRADAYHYLGNYKEAIKDSIEARGLNPKWTHAYYRQGRAQFMNGQFKDSLAVFSFGLAQEPTNKCLFDALVDAMLNSPFKQDFEPKYNKLKSLGFLTKPFVVVSVIGQELLEKGHGEHAAIILESALKMGPENKRFKGSVLSTISCAYCIIGDYGKAVNYMQKELDIENELKDVNGQCRVLSNLGYTYFKMRKFDKSLESHRKLITLAIRNLLFPQASVALNAIGHVHAARQDYTSALLSHTRCLDILRQLGDNDYTQFKELLSIGHIHSLLGDYKATDDTYNEALELLKMAKNKISHEDYQTGLVMFNFNLAYLSLRKQMYEDAKHCYLEVIRLAERMQPRAGFLYEMRAYNGLGQTHRLLKEFDDARSYFEKQLDKAKILKDQSGQSQALCNLGMIYQHFKHLDKSWAYFNENLVLVKNDPLLRAYALSYIGSMYFLTNRYAEAHESYEESLNLFKELDYCTEERKTIELNVAAINVRMSQTEPQSLPSNETQQKKVMLFS